MHGCLVYFVHLRLSLVSNVNNKLKASILNHAEHNSLVQTIRCPESPGSSRFRKLATEILLDRVSSKLLNSQASSKLIREIKRRIGGPF